MSSDPLDRQVVSLLIRHPSVAGVRLTGSRAEGRAHERSDWDFAIEATDFDAVASALPGLMAPLGCVAQQWDPLSPDWCWMVLLPGAIKVDLVLAGRAHALEPPWVPSAATLEAIDMHFWDWMLWLDSKPRSNSELHESELNKLLAHLLAPLGVNVAPRSVAEAVAAYRSARSQAEARFGVHVPRRIEEEVSPELRPD